MFNGYFIGIHCHCIIHDDQVISDYVNDTGIVTWKIASRPIKLVVISFGHAYQYVYQDEGRKHSDIQQPMNVLIVHDEFCCERLNSLYAT